MVAGAPAGLGAVHRGIGATGQRVRDLGRLRRDRDAQAGAELDHLPLDLEALAQAEQCLFRDPRGIVAMAHPGNPALADSQMFILKAAVPSYDGKYTIVGRVTAGMAVVDRLAVADMIKQATIKAAGPNF